MQWHELERLEDQRVHSLQDRLDQEATARQARHVQELAAAAAEHQYVRDTAERAYQKLLQQEREARQSEQRQQEADQLSQRAAEERQQLQLLRQQAAALQREREEAEAAQRKREQEQATLLRQQEEAWEARAAKAQEQARQHKTQQTAPPPQQAAPVAQPSPAQNPTSPTNNAAITPLTPSTIEDAHQRYLALHGRLKDMRKQAVAQSKQHATLKNRMGDMRREIKKCVGQLTEDNVSNRIPMTKVRNVLREAASFSQPSTDVRQFLANPPPPGVNQDDNQAPLTLIYLLNIFSKAVIKQLTDEAGVAPKAADPLGILSITMFSVPEFRWQGVSLIDILVAKFHLLCPVLFGIYGSEKTESGRKRLGWWKNVETGSWISEQDHTNRMTGLGAGYAALTLRDFKNSKSANPYPPQHYWQAMACIVKTPPQHTTQTHLIVLKALIEHHVPKFIGFYGRAALVALRQAIVEFPRQAPQSVASSALSTLQTTLQRDIHVTL